VAGEYRRRNALSQIVEKPLTEMTEAELAAFYYEHRDDPTIWGDPVPAPKRRGPPKEFGGIRLTVRFTPAEADRLDAECERTGETYSALVRRLVGDLAAR
jgi:hypothetical protein